MSKVSIAYAQQSSAHRSLKMIGIWFCIVMMSFCAMLVSVAFGQAPAKPQYEQLKFNPAFYTDKNTARMVNQIRNEVLRDAAALDDPTTAQRFGMIVRNDIASMTIETEFENIAARRAQIMKDIDRANRAGNTRVYQSLVNLAFGECDKIAKGNYHPVARINAVLMLGEFNQSEAVSFPERKPPVALNGALATLVAIVSDPQNQYTDGLKVAALKGLHRHAILNGDTWNQGQQDNMADLMETLAESECPANRDPEGHGWMQGLAIDVLRTLNNPRGEHPKKLASLIIDVGKPKASNYLLIRTARLIPNYTVPDSAGFKPQTETTVKAWAGRIADVIATEAERLEVIAADSLQARFAGANDAEEGGVVDEGFDDEGDIGTVSSSQSQDIIRARRMLNYVLESFHSGLAGTPLKIQNDQIKQGLVALAEDAQKERATELVGLIDSATRSVNRASIDKEYDYAKMLRFQEKQFRAYVDPQAGGAAAAAADTTDVTDLFPDDL